MNAIIMAAGKGERMRPLTLKTPKPLIKINDIPMIENLILSMKEVGVNDITIVTGYLKEQFDYLKQKYGVRIIENPDYEIANNISSLYYAREYLDETLILDGDQIISNKNILRFDFKHSGYVCTKNNVDSREWILTLDEDNKIIHCSRNGGNSGYELKSLSFWNKDDTKKLKKYLEEDYIKENRKDIYWDDVAMFVHNKDFNLYGYIIDKGDITEIDSIDELIEIDNSYGGIK